MSKTGDADGFFGTVVSTYTDDQAVDDGVLVAVSGRDRVTRAVWEWLCASLPGGPKPPNFWPVDLFGWFRPRSSDDRALALARGLLDTNRRRAHEVYEKNLEGGIFKATARVKDGKIVGLECEDGEPRVLWLVPNELGGLTLMFPEDW